MKDKVYLIYDLDGDENVFISNDLEKIKKEIKEICVNDYNANGLEISVWENGLPVGYVDFRLAPEITKWEEKITVKK